MKKTWVAARLSLQYLKLPYIVTGIALFLLLFLFLLSTLFYNEYSGTMVLSSAFTLLPLLSAVMVPLFINRRLVSLNAKRKDLLINAAVVYAIVCALAALLLVIIRAAVEHPLEAKHENFYFSNPFEIKSILNRDSLGMLHGEIIKLSIPLPILFFQQFFLFYLLCSACNMLVSLQKNWIGWVLDVIIVTTIIVFSYVRVDINYSYETLLKYLEPIISNLLFGKAYIQIPIAVGLTSITAFINLLIIKYQKFS